MINIYIYLDNQKDAKRIVEDLFEQQLVAHAAIDFNNSSFWFEDGKIKEKENCLITAQTKALLFDEVAYYLSNKVKSDVKFYSMPITQTNLSFGDYIRNNTRKI